MHEDLICKFRQGDKRAGDDFYKANIKLIKYTAYRLKTNDLTHEETLALVNQAFARCVNKYDEARGQFSTILMTESFGVIQRHRRDYNQMIRQSRKMYRNKEFIICSSLDELCNEEESWYNSHGVEDDYTNLEVREALSILTEKDRRIFLLYSNGYSQSEISKCVDMSQVNISRRLKKAREKLQNYYKKCVM